MCNQHCQYQHTIIYKTLLVCLAPNFSTVKQYVREYVAHMTKICQYCVTLDSVNKHFTPLPFLVWAHNIFKCSLLSGPKSMLRILVQ